LAAPTSSWRVLDVEYATEYGGHALGYAIKDRQLAGAAYSDALNAALAPTTAGGPTRGS
jgi:hypothetical protein